MSSIGVGSMIWDNISIFRTNCAIGCGTRAYIAARIFADVAQGKWRPKFLKVYSIPLGMSRFISPRTKLSFADLFTRTLHYSNLNFTYEEDYNSFSTTQKKN